jgi:hypothetical protein
MSAEMSKDGLQEKYSARIASFLLMALTLCKSGELVKRCANKSNEEG